jgi:hypothetical protein
VTPFDLRHYDRFFQERLSSSPDFREINSIAVMKSLGEAALPI